MFTRFRSLRLSTKMRRKEEKSRSVCDQPAAAFLSASSSSTSVFYYSESLYADPDYPLPASSSSEIPSKVNPADNNPFKRSISEPICKKRKSKAFSSASSSAVDAELDDVIRMMTGSSSAKKSKVSTGKFMMSGNGFNFDEDDEGFSSGDAILNLTVTRRQKSYTPPWLKEDWTRRQAMDYVFLELSYPGAFIVRRPQHRQLTSKESPNSSSLVKERHVYSLTAMNDKWEILNFQIFETECDGFGAESDSGLKMLHFKDSMPHLDLTSMIAFYHTSPVPSEKGEFFLKPTIVRESLILS